MEKIVGEKIGKCGKLRDMRAPGAPGTCECFYRNRYRYR